MTKSTRKRSNSYARKIAALIDVDLSTATIAFDHAEARNFAREFGFDAHMLHEANAALLAELLNLRMPKRRPSKPRAFAPYADTFRPEYREPNHDPARAGRRTPTERAERDFRDFAAVGSW